MGNCEACDTMAALLSEEETSSQIIDNGKGGDSPRFLRWGNRRRFSAKQKAENEAFYREAAKYYADTRAWTDANTRAIETGLLVYMVENFRPGDRVLVIGTGTGRDQDLIEHLGDRMGFLTVGVDISRNMLKEAKRKITKDGELKDRSINLVQIDPGRLPFGDGTIDVIYCEAAGEHMDEDELRILLPEMRRVLRDRDPERNANVLFNLRLGDGNVVTFEDGFNGSRWEKHFATYTTRSAIETFNDNGFDLVSSWHAPGGTPNAENYCPWFDAMWRVRKREE